MGKFEFVRRWIFVKLYLLLTIIMLLFTLVFNLFGFSGNLAIQSAAGIFDLIGIPLMIGQLLLIMTVANKGDQIGWIIVRLSYITLFVACLGLLLITMGTFAFSFVFSASGSIGIGQLFSTVGFTMLVAFGICFSALCYYTLSIESAWCLSKTERKGG